MRPSFIKKYQSLFRFCLAVFDVVWVLIAGIVAHWLHFSEVVFDHNYWTVLWLSVLFSAVIFSWFGLYKPFREKRLSSYLFDVTLSIIFLVACLSVLAFFTKQGAVYSRLWFGAWFVLIWLGLIISRISSFSVLVYLRHKGYNTKNIIVIGANQRALELVEKINKDPWTGVRVVSLLTEEKSISKLAIVDVPAQLMPENLADFVKTTRAHEVWLVLPLKQEELIKHISQKLIRASVTLRYVPDLLGLTVHEHTFSEMSGYPLMDLYSSSLSGGRYWLKFIEDKLLALFFLILASPVMLIIALAVKLSSPGPVLFKQMRHGWNGKKIKVYKFRSMRMHKEGPGGALTQAVKNDSRITRVGRLIRKTSLDELPQFINVLQGRMSLVGPRPHAVEHDEYYQDLVTSYMQRFRMKPGITGWAQVNGCRGETDTIDKMQKRIEHDVYYIEHWSVLLDLRIILLTCFKLFYDKNAY